MLLPEADILNKGEKKFRAEEKRLENVQEERTKRWKHRNEQLRKDLGKLQLVDEGLAMLTAETRAMDEERIASGSMSSWSNHSWRSSSESGRGGFSSRNKMNSSAASSKNRAYKSTSRGSSALKPDNNINAEDGSATAQRVVVEEDPREIKSSGAPTPDIKIYSNVTRAVSAGVLKRY